MSRAHNPWGAEPGTPAQYAQARYHHDQDPRATLEAQSPAPSAYLDNRQVYAFDQEPNASYRPTGAAGSMSYGHGPPAYPSQGGLTSPSTAISPGHANNNGHGLYDASHPLLSPTSHDPKYFPNHHRSYGVPKSEPSAHGPASFADQPSALPANGYQYPSAIQRRPSASALPGSMQPPTWPIGMSPPSHTAPSQEPATAKSVQVPDEEPSRNTPASRAGPQNGRTAAMMAKYRICVRQHPVAARSCGFGERDRRVIDPPPIIQVLVDDPQITDSECRRILRYPWGVMHCTIWTEDGQQDCSSMQDEFRTNRRLMGTPVSSPFVGTDDEGEEGCFYCFPDLSVRTPGSFRLHFTLAILDPLMQKNVPVVAGVMSDVFKVYNAKDFPGMKASTSLTKALKKQGCLISIKKGKEHTGIPRLPDSGDEDDEDDDGDVRFTRPVKKFRK